MTRLIASIATATFLTAGAAVAQMSADDMQNMNDSLATVQASVESELVRLGVDAEAGDITLRQMAEIQLILSDASLSDAQRTDQINTLIN